MDMLLRLVTITLFITGTAFSQDVFSIYSRLGPPSPTSGNGAQVGIGVDTVIHTGQYVMLDIDASLVREPKSYVGNGWTVRGQAEGLVRLGDWYVGGGMTSGRHMNSAYSKNQFQPLISLHYRPHLLLDMYGVYLPRAFGNDNGVQGWRAGYRGVLRAAPTSPYGMFVQVEFTQYRFQTAFGDKRSATGIVTGIGLSRIVEKIR